MKKVLIAVLISLLLATLVPSVGSTHCQGPHGHITKTGETKK